MQSHRRTGHTLRMHYPWPTYPLAVRGSYKVAVTAREASRVATAPRCSTAVESGRQCTGTRALMQALFSTHAARALLPGPEGCEHAVGAALGAVVAAAAAAASTLTMLTSATLARVAGSAWLPRVSDCHGLRRGRLRRSSGVRGAPLECEAQPGAGRVSCGTAKTGLLPCCGAVCAH